MFFLKLTISFLVTVFLLTNTMPVFSQQSQTSENNQLDSDANILPMIQVDTPSQASQTSQTPPINSTEVQSQDTSTSLQPQTSENNQIISDMDINPSGNFMEATVQSQRIPVYTRIKLRIEDSINTLSSEEGEQFTATIVDDIKVDNNITLPAGTIIRGTINSVKKASYLYQSAQLFLSFDHVVTPVGKQIPIAAKLSGLDNITKNNSIKADGGYFKKVKSNFSESVNFVGEAKDCGFDMGDSFLNGYPSIITVPVTVVGGTVISSGAFVVKSAANLFQKGNDVVFNPGQYLEMTLTQPLDVPVN